MKAVIIALAVTLTGCAGYTLKEPIINPDGTVARNVFGATVYKKERLSRTAVLSRDATAAKIAVANAQQQQSTLCEMLLNAKADSATGEGEKFRALDTCIQSQNTVSLVGVALGRPQSDIEAISQNEARAIKHMQDGMTARTKSIVGGSVQTVFAGSVASVLNTISGDRRDVGVAAAETGNVTTGDIYATTGQTASTSSQDSNDVIGGSSELIPTTGSTSASGTATTNGAGGDVNLSLGNHNVSSLARDDGNSQIDTQAALNNETSATAAQNLNANTDQQPVIDTANNLDFNNNPVNGAGNTNSRSDEPVGPI